MKPGKDPVIVLCCTSSHKLMLLCLGKAWIVMDGGDNCRAVTVVGGGKYCCPLPDHQSCMPRDAPGCPFWVLKRSGCESPGHLLLGIDTCFCKAWAGLPVVFPCVTVNPHS